MQQWLQWREDGARAVVRQVSGAGPPAWSPPGAARDAPDVAMHGIDCFVGGGTEKNRLYTCVCVFVRARVAQVGHR